MIKLVRKTEVYSFSDAFDEKFAKKSEREFIPLHFESITHALDHIRFKHRRNKTIQFFIFENKILIAHENDAQIFCTIKQETKCKE